MMAMSGVEKVVDSYVKLSIIYKLKCICCGIKHRVCHFQPPHLHSYLHHHHPILVPHNPISVHLRYPLVPVAFDKVSAVGRHRS